VTPEDVAAELDVLARRVAPRAGRPTALEVGVSEGRRGRIVATSLSLPNDGRYPALDLNPQQCRQKTLEALTAQMEARWKKGLAASITSGVSDIFDTVAVARTLSHAPPLDPTLRYTLHVYRRDEECQGRKVHFRADLVQAGNRPRCTGRLRQQGR